MPELPSNSALARRATADPQRLLVDRRSLTRGTLLVSKVLVVNSFYYQELYEIQRPNSVISFRILEGRFSTTKGVLHDVTGSLDLSRTSFCPRKNPIELWVIL